MDFKKVTVGFFAAVMAMTSVCFADPETPVTTDVPVTDPVPETTTTAQPQREDTETTTTTTAQTWETTTWGTTTSYSYVPDTPTSTPTVVKLVVSEVKDKKFTAKINIQCDHLISNASISVGYDDSLVEFEKCETNDKAGGMAVDNAFAGKFVYNYVNADGTDFDGDYATLHFKVADEKLTSTVLYLTVNSLDDENLNAISNQVENGIVKYQDAADVQQDDSDYIEIDVDYSKYPIAPEDIGLTDVDSVTVANGEVLIFEDGTLRNGMSLKLLFEQLRDIRKDVKIPLVFMGYLNPIMQFGFENFCRKCVECGIDGVIIPDLPFRDYQEHYRIIAERYNIKVIMLITPETSEERVREIDTHTDGFIYMVSSAATTGAQQNFNEQKQAYFKKIKDMHLNNPLMIGFGISNKATFQAACEHASGAIIGSKFVTLLEEEKDPEKAILKLKEAVK